MLKTRMDMFMLSFDRALKYDLEYIAIFVKIKGNDKPEIIINHKDNFKSKRDYYKKAYNENLELKANTDIEIVNYLFAENLSELFLDISTNMED